VILLALDERVTEEDDAVAKTKFEGSRLIGGVSGGAKKNKRGKDRGQEFDDVSHDL
jgi:hypothetical protein